MKGTRFGGTKKIRKEFAAQALNISTTATFF